MMSTTVVESYKNMINADKHSFGGPSERGFTYLPINNVQKAAKSKTFAELARPRRAGCKASRGSSGSPTNSSFEGVN
ncbi:hypothetical protein ED312_19480 [Sinomicrobium pectinilyticum]|uniref:Uncharacterized protein n=1 Tax=Sinomicrobium pectinilyticum TaxID=1084421 RepID=A0A3N0DRD2_SINP1|nr:hypothetical protein ED312_19480 [Sinomicrobium pectinilyticum]